MKNNKEGLLAALRLLLDPPRRKSIPLEALDLLSEPILGEPHTNHIEDITEQVLAGNIKAIVVIDRTGIVADENARQLLFEFLKPFGR